MSYLSDNSICQSIGEIDGQHVQNGEEFPKQQDQFDQQLNKTIKKKKKMQRETPNTQITQNFGPGRPNNHYENEVNAQNQHPEINNYWFGSMMSTQLLIYFCQEGQLTLKMRTGYPGKQISRQLEEVFKKAEKAKVVKFKRNFKKQIKKKQESILEYLGYRKNIKYLLLSKEGSTSDLNLVNTTLAISNALQVISKQLSPQFINSFKLIVEYYFQNYQIKRNYDIVQDLVQKIKENPTPHKQLLDLQLLRTLLDQDLHDLKQLEDAYHVQYYFEKGTKVEQISLQSLPKCQNAILVNSFWLQSFLERFLKIIGEGNTQIYD